MSKHWELYNQAMQSFAKEPDTALQLLQEATELAKEAEDHRAILHMNHWILQKLIFHKRDYQRAYELAIATALEARKPAYAQLQDHICVQQDLIFSYLGTDPHGNAPVIEDAIAYMDSQISGNIGCRYCWHELKSSFYLATGNIKQAKTASQEYLEISEGGWYRSHHGAIACSVLCEVAYREQAWDDLHSYAQLGTEWIQDKNNLSYHVCALLASQVIALYHRGEHNAAAQLYRKTVMRAERAESDMLPVFYDMLCDYHRLTEDLQAALWWRQKQLGEIVGKGQKYQESRCRLDLARVLKELGRPYHDMLAEAREVIETLKIPKPLLEELAAIGE